MLVLVKLVSCLVVLVVGLVRVLWLGGGGQRKSVRSLVQVGMPTSGVGVVMSLVAVSTHNTGEHAVLLTYVFVMRSPQTTRPHIRVIPLSTDTTRSTRIM